MKQALRTIGFMVLIATVFGAGVTGIRLATDDILLRNRDLAFQRSVVNVFGLAEGVQDPDYAKIYEQRITREIKTDPETGREIPCYTVYEGADKKTPVAVGFEFVGRGFWGPISGVLALTNDRKETIGLTILEQGETPGLGGRVAEPEFTDQFAKGVLVAPEDSGRYIRVSATAPSPDSPSAKRHVETITGATQTSMAMDRMLNDSLAAYHRAVASAETKGEQANGNR
jgi:Na+-transporting NADH:ubiquinone oxidoreductase subunit C